MGSSVGSGSIGVITESLIRGCGFDAAASASSSICLTSCRCAAFCLEMKKTITRINRKTIPPRIIILSFYRDFFHNLL
jgi:hypothetical protein